MIRGWVPLGELLRQYLRVDTNLEPVFYPEAATHINSFPKTLFSACFPFNTALKLTFKLLQVPQDQVEYMCQLIEALRDYHLDATERWKVK